MKKLSPPQFRDYLEQHSFEKFIYLAEKQKWHTVDSTIKIDLTFRTIYIFFNPNIIYLTDKKENVVRFRKVKSIEVKENHDMEEAAFTITCGSSVNNDCDVKYTLIARR